MPDIIMHNHFARVVYHALDVNVQKAITNINLYDFASNGPDPFFYVNFLNKKKQAQYYEFGEEMHKKNTFAFIEKLTSLAKLNKDLFPYLCGYITHYYLDSLTHPFIFYKTGVYDTKINNSIRYRGLHMKMEKAMDCYVLENYYNVNPNTFNISNKVCKLNHLPKTIQPDMDVLFESIYNQLNGYKLVNKSIKFHKRFYRFIYDPTGIKNKLFSRFDNGKSTFDFNYLSYYNKSINTRNFDIFNFKHDRWNNPVDDTKVSTDSFFDLFERAKDASVMAIEAIFKYIYLDEEINLRNYFIDISMLSGMLVEKDNEMKYFKNIFK